MSNSWTLGLALASFVLSIVTLGWQMITWRLGRAVIRVEAKNSEAVGVEGSFTTITVRNLGGMPVKITMIYLVQHRRRFGRLPVLRRLRGVRSRDEVALVFPPVQLLSDPLPHRLEPGDAASFMVYRAGVVQRFEELEVKHMYPAAALSTGKVRTGPAYVPFELR